MTNNTTSHGGDFTIKPLTTSIDIITERQLIAAWSMAGLSDSQIIKMLKLYFGEPAWMNFDKVYDCNMFGQIAKGLKFHNRHDFVELIIKCKGFGFIWMNEKEHHTDRNLLAFYTPTWHEPKVEEMNSEDFHAGDGKDSTVANGKDSTSANGKDLSGNEQVSFRYYDNNIYNKKKNIKKKNISPYTSGSQLAQVGNLTPAPSGQNLAEYQQLVETTARNLIAYVATNPVAYANVVKPINEITSKEINGLYTDPDAVCPANKATAWFFNNYVFPYMLSNSKRMMSLSSLEGQSCWLKNLINLKFMRKKLMLAIADTRRELVQNPTEMHRQNRPISKFEYQDKASGQRFYDTTLQNEATSQNGATSQSGALVQHRIPPEAPPRPSEQATWNKFSHCWMTPKTEKAENTPKAEKAGNTEKTQKMDKTEKM